MPVPPALPAAPGAVLE